MKKQAFRIVTLLSLLVTLTAATVHAQSKRSTINIPFSFTVGQTTLPAGEYTVEPNQETSSAVWLVQNKNGNESILFTTGATWTRDPRNRASLVFNNYDGQHFLAEIWVGGNNSGRELKMPRLERELAKNGIQRERVVVISGAGQ